MPKSTAASAARVLDIEQHQSRKQSGAPAKLAMKVNALDGLHIPSFEPWRKAALLRCVLQVGTLNKALIDSFEA